MSKKSLPILFIIIFITFTVVPYVFVFIDDTVDISILISVSDEEEEQGENKNKRKKIKALSKDNIVDSIFFSAFKNIEYINCIYKKYTKPHLNIISPPPEFI